MKCVLSQFIPLVAQATQTSAMVTSTSTPGSIEIDVICLTTSDGECRSIKRLWILISKRSKVFVPSPHGVLRTQRRSFFVGRRTGPATWRFFSLAPEMRSAQTFSKDLTSRLVNVIRIRWSFCSSPSIVFAGLAMILQRRNQITGDKDVDVDV